MSIDAPTAPVPTPWHRQPWPWILLAGPAIVVVAGLVTAWLAVRSDDGIVAQDYYKRGLLINRHLEKASRGAAIAAMASLGADGSVRVRLEGAGAARPPHLSFRLAHPTRAGRDRVILLGPETSGDYVGVVEALPPGRWIATVETPDWRLPAAEVTAPFDAVRLGAGAIR
jgi:hypothetical protein